MKIYNIKEKPEFMYEVCLLENIEWGSKELEGAELENKIKSKIEKIKLNLDKINYCKLVLIDKDELIGFISLFEKDGKYRKDLTPWYATMYVKHEYRGMGYSKILNEAILKEAKNRGFNKVYLKTDLVNYYEKFGAKYMEYLPNGEKLYYIEII